MQSTFQTWATDIVPDAGAAGLASSHDYHTLFLLAAVITLPVLVGGSVGRWRYRGSEHLGEVVPGSPIG